MSAITIRKLPDEVHDALRRIAAERGVSVEALAREALEKLADSPEGLGVSDTLAALDRRRRELGVAPVGDAWREAFDDPAFSREVLGLDADEAHPAGGED